MTVVRTSRQFINAAGSASSTPTPYDPEREMRYRSFVERYVINRTPHFRLGQEKEDAWFAMKDAETIYKRIARSGRNFSSTPMEEIYNDT